MQFACHSGPNQQWVLADAPEGNLRLVARHSGRSLDVQGAVSTEGTGLIQWPWSGDPNQRFKLAVAKDAPDAERRRQDARSGAAVAAKGKEKDKGGAAKKKKPRKSPEVGRPNPRRTSAGVGRRPRPECCAPSSSVRPPTPVSGHSQAAPLTPLASPCCARTSRLRRSFAAV